MKRHRSLYSVRGCVEDGGCVEEVPDSEAEFFGLYYQLPDGRIMWRSDHATREGAEEHALQNETVNV